MRRDWYSSMSEDQAAQGSDDASPLADSSPPGNGCTLHKAIIVSGLITMITKSGVEKFRFNIQGTV